MNSRSAISVVLNRQGLERERGQIGMAVAADEEHPEQVVADFIQANQLVEQPH